VSTKINGGPAFPSQPVQKIDGAHIAFEQGGMTLRDYFAARAMRVAYHRYGGIKNAPRLAQDAYIIADAMLKAREEPT
jgi:hypothetical protein